MLMINTITYHVGQLVMPHPKCTAFHFTELSNIQIMEILKINRGIATVRILSLAIGIEKIKILGGNYVDAIPFQQATYKYFELGEEIRVSLKSILPYRTKQYKYRYLRLQRMKNLFK